MKRQNEDLINTYLAEHISIAKGFPVMDVSKLVDAVETTYKKVGQVFIFGNGGGASIASHFASDLGIHPFVSEDKHIPTSQPRLSVHCLTDSVGLITRLANDIEYEAIFVEQLKSASLNSRDLVIALSNSGNSPNVVLALQYGKVCGAITTLIGGRDGGKAKKFTDICILIPTQPSHFPGQVGANDNCFHIEDFQSSIAHMVTGILKERINE